MPILLYITIIFWLLSIAQISLVPYWAGDLVFVFMFAWGLFLGQAYDRTKGNLWRFWLPPLIGLGAASFIFYSYYVVLPYLVAILIIYYLLSRKHKWIFRFKEGFTYFLLVIVLYFASVLLVRVEILKYSVPIDLYIRILISAALAFVIWFNFALNSTRGRIR